MRSSCISTIATFLPYVLWSSSAISQPVRPPPITTTFCGACDISPKRKSTASTALSAPGIGILFAVAPVATITSSALSEATSLTSVFI